MWGGLGFIIYAARFTAMFGAAKAPAYQLIFETIPVLFAVAVQPTVATISDYTISRWGRRKPYIFIGALLDVVFLYGFASSNEILVMFAFIMLLQFSSNFAQGPFQGYVPDLVPREQVGLASGLMGVMIVIGQVHRYRHCGDRVIYLHGQSPYVAGTPEAGQYAQQVFLWPTVGPCRRGSRDDGAFGFVRSGGPQRAVTRGPFVVPGRTFRVGNGYSARAQLRLDAGFASVLPDGADDTAFSRAVLPAPVSGFRLRGGRLQILAVVAVVGVTTGLATLPAAKLSDRFGRKSMIYLGIAIGAVGGSIVWLGAIVRGRPARDSC